MSILKTLILVKCPEIRNYKLKICFHDSRNIGIYINEDLCLTSVKHPIEDSNNFYEDINHWEEEIGHNPEFFTKVADTVIFAFAKYLSYRA